MRAREPVSDHDILNILQSARTTFVVLACAALIGLSLWLIIGPTPPDHDVALPGEHSAKQFAMHVVLAIFLKASPAA
jgi:hypothetical protein